jgi:ureidoglycolate lyase
MKKVQVKPLTAEAFAKYGSFAMMINPKAPKLGKDPVEFYRDMVPLETCGASPMFSVCRVKSRPAVIDVTEYHTRCGEGALALDTDVLMHFGIATADGKPPLDEIEVFRVPKGTFLAIRPGVWHHAPFTAGANEANVLVVLPERTYANDCVVVELPADQRLQIDF